VFGDEFGEETPTPGNPSGFMAYHVSIGTSARGALAEWRELGGTTGDHKWYELYGQVSDTIMRTEGAAGLEPGSLPLPSDYGVWSMGNGGQYASQVNVTYIDNETGLRSSAPFTWVTDDPHTPEEAEQAAIDEYTGDDNAERYGQTITGAFTVHVWTTEPFSG
jgi:hypothetical protein